MNLCPFKTDQAYVPVPEYKTVQKKRFFALQLSHYFLKI